MKWIRSIAMALGITVAIMINIIAICLFNVTYNFVYLIPVIVSFISWLSVLVSFISLLSVLFYIISD